MDPMDPDFLTIGEMLPELGTLSGKRPPSYSTLWMMVVEGKLPARLETTPKRRWLVRRDDVRPIALMLGLIAPPDGKLPFRGANAGEGPRPPYMTVEQARAVLKAADRKRPRRGKLPKAA